MLTGDSSWNEQPLEIANGAIQNHWLKIAFSPVNSEVLVVRFIVLLTCMITSSAHASSKADFAALYKNHSASVVTVFKATLEGGQDVSETQLGIGSGVLVEEDKILTAAHVVGDSSAIEVLFTDGTRISADVISSLEASDIALIQLREKHPDTLVARLADSNDTPIGSEVFIIGAPFGISQTLSVGHLSGRLNRGLMAGGTPIEFLQTDTAINTGNSGGPMFNVKGEVIGIVSFILTKSGGFDGIGFATSSNTARQALLESPGVIAGFESIVLDDKVASLLNFPQGGLLVQRVSANSIMEKAGLLAGTVPSEIGGQRMLLGGDLILSIDGLICDSPHNFSEALPQLTEEHINEAVAITVFRDGRTIKLFAGPDEENLVEMIQNYSNADDDQNHDDDLQHKSNNQVPAH